MTMMKISASFPHAHGMDAPAESQCIRSWSPVARPGPRKNFYEEAL